MQTNTQKEIMNKKIESSKIYNPSIYLQLLLTSVVPFMVRPLIFENPQYITVSGLLWPISNYVNSSRERELVDVSFLL